MSARLPDYYAILHVDPAAPAAVIRASYRTLMQQLRAHPDLGGEHETAARLNAAYAVLKDPRRRAEYDAERAAAHDGPSAGRGGRHSGAAEPGSAGAAMQDPTAGRTESGSTGIWVQASSVPARIDICAFCGVAARETGGHADSADECRVCAAPLTIVRPMLRDAAQTQRSVYRIAKAETLRVFVSPADRTGIDAFVHDISLSGIRFSCARPIGVGDLVRVECEMCDAVARVAHASQSAAGETQYGAQFLTVRFRRQRGSLLSVPV